MASLNCGEPSRGEECKTQFSTREGVYRLVSAADFSRSARPVTYVANSSPSPGATTPPVRLSFVTISESSDSDEGSVQGQTSPGSQDQPFMNSVPEESNIDLDLLSSNQRFCFNMGKDLLVYPYHGCRKMVDINKPIDKRGYKGTNPTCHDFNSMSATRTSLPLLIGFSGGQIQLVDPIYKDCNVSKLFNEERIIDKTRVTCIRWIPKSINLFLVAHGSGHMYLYNADTPCGTAPPHYQIVKHGPGYTVWNSKNKTPRNPLTRWSLGEGAVNSPVSSPVNEFSFSSCGQFIAIVSQDGFLRIFRYDTYELVGLTRSYFGGLICVNWSPDGKYVVCGGEDDLVTLWSFKERRVVARGQGHKSWVTVVAFDPFTSILDGSYDDDDVNECHNCHSSSGVFSCDSTTTCAIGAAPPVTSSHNSSSNGNNSVCTSCGQIKGSHNNSSSGVNKHIVNNHNSNNSFIGRTSRYSRTSESMRLSTSESTTATRIPTCYRVGSVGQDTQLCLWDLTEDIIKQPLGKLNPRTPGELSPYSNSKLQNQSHNLIHSSNTTTTSNNSNIPNGGNCSPVTTTTTTTHNNDSEEVNLNSASGTDGGDESANGGTNNKSPNFLCTSTTNGNSGNNNTTSSSSSSNNGNNSTSQQQQQHSTGHSILSLRFGALSFGGDKDKSSSNKDKEHKRNFSLGSSKTDKNNAGSSKNSSMGSLGLGVNVNLDDPMKLIGTNACPRLDECPLLEPLVCKKISHERLTSLTFREDVIVTACNDAVICTWARPHDLGSSS